VRQEKIEPPKFGRATTEQSIIPVIMRWLHDRGCAVVVWTEEELKGVDVDSLEGSLIEWGAESIQMNAEEVTK
jgi:hypothetical protein